MTSRPKTPLLDTVNTPDDLRKLGKDQLRQLSDELRAEMIDAVGQTGGHLGSGLGVVELTTAIHYVFNTPEDKLVWDVGHQCYPHKILTGRRDRIRTLRQGGGLSGFTKRAESEYDPFGAAHSSTSISAALGFAMANKMQNRPGRGIAVIGDGAMSAGMAYEAMNNAEQAGNRLVVILNDNDMSIAPPVGGLSAYLARMVSSSEYLGLRSMASRIARKMGRRVWGGLEKAEEYARGMVTGGTMFEELGFYYVGPIDGHNLDHLIPVLENVRDSEQGPVLIHVVTTKGKGYAPAENSADKYHGVAKFDVVTGVVADSPARAEQIQGEMSVCAPDGQRVSGKISHATQRDTGRGGQRCSLASTIGRRRPDALMAVGGEYDGLGLYADDFSRIDVECAEATNLSIIHDQRHRHQIRASADASLHRLLLKEPSDIADRCITTASHSRNAVIWSLTNMRQASFATAEHESPALQLSKCVHGGTTGSGCGHLVT